MRPFGTGQVRAITQNRRCAVAGAIVRLGECADVHDVDCEPATKTTDRRIEVGPQLLRTASTVARQEQQALELHRVRRHSASRMQPRHGKAGD